MKIISRYVSTEFIKILLIIVAAFMVLYMLVDVFENLGDFTKAHSDFFTASTFFLYRLPQAIYYTVPLSLLVASFLNLGLFTKYNELIALRSGGLSIHNITLPVLTVSFLISVGTFFLNDSIIPVTNKKAEDIMMSIEAKPREMFFKEDSLWLKAGNYTIYNVRFIDPDKKIMGRINIYYLTPDFKIRESISAEKAVSEHEQWFLKSGVKRIFNTDNTYISLRQFDSLPIDFPFRLNDFRHVIVQASETRYSILKNYIDTIKREGYEVKRLTVDLYSKTSFPFSGFILSIFGIAFGFSIKRYGGLAGGIGLCILTSVLYWTGYSLSIHMGYSGYFNPLLSAWLTNLSFAAVGGIMYFRAMRL